MYDRILVPTDGSDVSMAAGRAAVALAEHFDSALHAIHVVENEPYPVGFDDAMAELARRGEEAVETIAGWATEAGVDVTTAAVSEGEGVHRAIVEYADENDAELVVMGTHGRSGVGRVLVGSVTEQTLRESSVPVMTVHGETVVDPAFDSILVPSDGSEGAESAVDHAVGLARATDATVHLLNVVDRRSLAGGDFDTGMVIETLTESGEQALAEARERAEAAGARVAEPTVLVGTPSREIVDYTDEHGIDCVVMGTHGRTGVGRVLLGSVTERVVRQSSVPVVATKAHNGSE